MKLDAYERACLRDWINSEYDPTYLKLHGNDEGGWILEVEQLSIAVEGPSPGDIFSQIVELLREA